MTITKYQSPEYEAPLENGLKGLEGFIGEEERELYCAKVKAAMGLLASRIPDINGIGSLLINEALDCSADTLNWFCRGGGWCI